MSPPAPDRRARGTERQSRPWRDLLAAGRPPFGFNSNQEITPPSNSHHLRDTTAGRLITVNAAPGSTPFRVSLGFKPDRRDGHTHSLDPIVHNYEE
jgi:hypothetical protein